MRERVFSLCLLALMMMLVTGCSDDRSVYYSTVARPTTINLYDSNSGNILWTKAIPVQHRLEMDFDRKDEDEGVSISGKPATTLTWKLCRDGQDEAVEREELALPGTDLYVGVIYRPGPEYPDGKPPEPLISNPKK